MLAEHLLWPSKSLSLSVSYLSLPLSLSLSLSQRHTPIHSIPLWQGVKMLAERTEVVQKLEREKGECEYRLRSE